jgi:hypothetical protein
MRGQFRNDIDRVEGLDWILSRRFGSSSSTLAGNVRGPLLSNTVAQFAGTLSVASFGAKGDGVTDDTTAIQTAINTAAIGNTIVFPYTGNNYLVTQPLLISSDSGVSGIILKSDGAASDSNGTAQVTIAYAGAGPITGSAATFASVTNDQYGLATIVTLTGMTSTAGVSVGDTITLSNAANAQMNISATITTVVGPTSVKYNGTALVRGTTYLPNSTDANNGSIHYSVSRPMVKIYSRGNRLENLTLLAAAGIGPIVDSTKPIAAVVNTHNEFINMNFNGGIFGVKIADYGPNATQPNNTDNHHFERCYFNQQTDTAFIVPNLTGQSKQHVLEHCVLFSTQPNTYSIRISKGSVKTYATYFQAQDTCVLIFIPIDSYLFRDTDVENSPRLLVTGTGSTGGAGNTTAPIVFDGLRYDFPPSQLPADGLITQHMQGTGLVVKNAEIGGGATGFANCTFGIASPIFRQIAAIFENVVLPNNVDKVVTPIGASSVNFRCSAVSNFDGTGVFRNHRNGEDCAIVSGVGAALPSSPVSTASPSVQLSLTNNNAGYPNQYHTAVELIGGGASAQINGFTAGDLDQIMVLTNLTGSNVTLTNEDVGQGTAANRIHSPTGANVVMTLGATLRYSPSISRWLITQFQ